MALRNGTGPPNAEGRPSAKEAPVQEDALSATSTIPEHTDIAAICDVFVVVVSTDDDHHRRRVFLSLHSAEKALRRSWDAGHRAEMLLCRLSPVASFTEPVYVVGSLTLASQLPVGVA